MKLQPALWNREWAAAGPPPSSSALAERLPPGEAPASSICSPEEQLAWKVVAPLLREPCFPGRALAGQAAELVEAPARRWSPLEPVPAWAPEADLTETLAPFAAASILARVQ